MLATEYIDEVFAKFRPPPKLTVTEWSDRYRFLSVESSAEPGRWKTSRAPYQRGMMDAMSDRGIHTIVDMTSSQVGKTEKQLNTLAYFSSQDPSPIMVVQPTIKMAEAFSKDRLAPMIRDTPELTNRFAKKSRDGENTIYHKKFSGGQITIAGANSPASLASRPIRVLLCDEIDRWPSSAGTEGDPLRLVTKRTATFHNRKIILSSTPGNKYVPGEGGSRIELAFLQSDQRYYFVPCPHCDHRQKLVWEQVKWDQEDGIDNPETAYYECSECQGKIYEHHKHRILAKGAWVATSTSNGIAGFHLSELYSPWKTLVEVVIDYLEAKDDVELYKVFVNTSLGLPFENKGGEQPDWQKLYNRREDRVEGVIPEQVVVLTAAVDVQKDRLEVSVYGWNRKQSWLIEHRKIVGDTAGDEVWEDLDELLDYDYQHPNGEMIPISRLGIDSGYQTTRVYEWVRTKSKRRVFALKGRDQLDVPVAAPKIIDVNFKGKKTKMGVQLWNVGVSVLKSELYGRLNLETPTDKKIEIDGYPKGYVHFPMVGEDYFKELTAETCVTEKVGSGHVKYVWKKTYPENHCLDCAIYNKAAYYVGGYHKWKEERWLVLEEYFGLKES